jgi:hypothetical protein
MRRLMIERVNHEPETMSAVDDHLSLTEPICWVCQAQLAHAGRLIHGKSGVFSKAIMNLMPSSFRVSCCR